MLEHSFSAVGLRDSNASCMNTWHNYNFSRKSWIDYVCVSQSIQELVESFVIREDGNMSSDHWAIMMSMNIVVTTVSNEKNHCLVSKQLLWKEATESDLNKYQQSLEMDLQLIYIFL